MKKLQALLAATVLVFAGTASNAFAASLTLETQEFNVGTFDNSNYAQSWTNNPNTITSNSISVFNQIYSGNNSFSHLAAGFNLGSQSSIGFQFGLDAGYGEALYFDNSLLDTDTSDLWWVYNWGNSDVVSVSINSLSSGYHVLDLYWAEGCCNGYSSGRFTTDYGQTWQVLSVANLEAAAVPEPSIIALFTAGLFGLGFARRKVRS